MWTLLGLIGAWLLWSGHYTFEHSTVLAGAVGSIAFVWWMLRRMRSTTAEPEGTVGPRVLPYLGWLGVEIVKANLHVARRILDPKLAIDPCIVRVKAEQRGESGRVLYANSITLTPGTISLEVREDRITVHALTLEVARDLLSGEMGRRVTAVEKPQGGTKP